MNNLDKKYTDLLGDVYNRYERVRTWELQGTPSMEEFINKIKTDDEFAKTWGFQVYTRELSLEERNDIYKKQWESGASELSHDRFDSLNIPTRAISLTYNNQTIEIYE